MMSTPTLTISDFTKQFNDAVKRFKSDAVLVGIPQDENERDEEDGESHDIGNAALLAINEFGSPANNIPSRPVMKTGIKNAQEAIAEQFKKAAQTVLSKGVKALETYYERAGIIASQACKKVINDQEGLAPPSDATLAARKARGFKGTKALVVTAQMRNSITYVVRSIWAS
jgi:ribosomal protein S20